MKRISYPIFKLVFTVALLGSTLVFGRGGKEDGPAKRADGAITSALDKELYGKGGTFEGFSASREVASKRTKYAKHFRNANGSYTVQTGDVYHYKDKSGAWKDISLAVEKSTGKPGYGYANETNEFKTWFPEKPGGTSVEMNLAGNIGFSWWNNPTLNFIVNGQTSQSFKPSDVEGTNTINRENASVNKTVTYPNVYSGISEEFVMMKNGIENNTIVHSLSSQLQSLPSGALVEFKQFIPLQSGWTVDVNGVKKSRDFKTGKFHISIPGTENGIFFSPVIVFDNTVTKDEALYLVYAPAEKLDNTQKAQKKAHVLEAEYEISFVSGGIEVSTLLPSDWLKASGRSFPVTIDPTVTITPTPLYTSNNGGYYYAPTSNWYGFQRHANLYLASEIGIGNIVISDIEYNRTTTNGTNAVKPYEVYMNTTTATTLTSAAWNSSTYTGANGGLTPLFNSSVDFHGTTTGWKMFTFTTPFLYTSDNLIVMVKDLYGGSGSAKTISQVYSNTSVANRQAYKRQDTNDPGDGSTLTLEDCLPEIRITYTNAQACSGQPTAGTIAGPASGSVCENAPFTLTTSGTTTDGDMVYDWQYDDGSGWLSTGGAGLSYPATAGISVATSFRLVVQCQNSNLYDTSNVISLAINPFYNCYCTPVSTCTNEGIQSVTFDTYTNPSSKCTNTTGYEDFGSLGSIATVTQGQQVSVSVTAWINSNPAGAGVWIDYDHNGVFDTTEFTLLGTFTGSFPSGGQAQVFTAPVTIDINALTGITRMRVRSANSTAATQISKYTECLTSNAYGEYEDYLITIAPAPTCSGTPNAVTVSTPAASVCLSSPFNLTTANATTGAGMSYEWQYDDGSGWQTLLDINSMPVTSLTYTVPGIISPTSYRFISTCSGGGSDTSNTVSLGINNFLLCYCIPTGGGNTSYGINNFSTTGGWVNISNLNSGTTPNPGYTDYSATHMLTTSTGSVITIAGSGMNTGTYGWAVWVDWNKNGSFADPGELMYNTTSYTNAIPANTTFTVPALDGNNNPVDTGYRKMRVVGNYNNNTPSTEYCSTTTGTAEWEDYMVNITDPPTCLPPTALTVTNVTASGVDLGWTENNGASNWYVEYGPAPLTPGTGTVIPQPVANPASVSGLSDNTNYQFYVRSICSPGTDTSVASTMGSFRTLCNPVTALPWTETFETASPSLSCWQVVDGNNDGDKWIPYTGYSHNGTYSMGLYTDYNAGNNSDWLISPGITLNGNQQLRYWYRARSSGEPNDYTVKLSTATADTLDFTTVIKPLTTISNTTYQEDVISLSGYTGTIYLAFHVPAGGLDGYYLYIDDVTVEDIPSCPPPTVGTASNVTTATADLDWVENGSAGQWEIEYGQGSFALGSGSRTIVSSNPATIPVVPSATYSYFVRSVCGANDTSVWSARSAAFVTPCITAIAPYVESFNTSSTPNCWTNPNTVNYNWLFSSSLNNSYGINITGDHTGNSGGNFAWVDNSYIYSGTNPSSAALTSPLIDISTLTNPQLRYYVVSYINSTYVANGHNKLIVDAWDDNLQDWVQVDSIQQNFPSQAWEERTIPLSVITSTLTQIRFTNKGMNSCCYNDILIDDVNVEETPSCPTPVTLTTSNATNSSIDVSWVSTGAQAQVEYGVGNFTLGTGTRTPVFANTGTYSLSSIAYDTSFKFYVRDVCGANDTSAWSSPKAFYLIPPNDDCANAVDITDQTPRLGTTGGATQTMAPCNSQTPIANDVWYSFNTASAGSVTITAVSNVADIVLEVFSGACGSLTTLTATSTSSTPTASGSSTCVDGPAVGTESATYSVAANSTYYVRIFGYNASEGTFTINATGAPLAIRLDKLSAVNVGTSNKVEWNTLSEERGDKFELERSADGKSFAKIYEKQANGAASRYTYMDNNPVKGYNYYRLRMTEANGNATYSEVVKAFVKSSGFEVEAYPNPVSHDLTVKVSGVQGADATVQVTDVTGKVIRTLRMTGSVETINMSGLAGGIYLIKYSDANHAQTIRVNKQ